MPPAKNRPVPDDTRSEIPTAREKQVAAAAHARKGKGTAVAQAQTVTNHNGLVNGSKETTAIVNGANGGVGAIAAQGQGAGMSWSTAPLPLLHAYRMAHNLSTSTAFSSPLRQALLTNPGIGRQSPTMARKKEKRRVSKDQLALAVRKHFNSAAVNEIDVVVEVIYRVKNQDKAFRMRSTPGAVKK